MLPDVYDFERRPIGILNAARMLALSIALASFGAAALAREAGRLPVQDSPAAPARETADACDAIARAVQRGNAQRRVAVSATVLDGRHPSGYRTMRSYLDGEQQLVVLDDRSYGPGSLERDDELRGRANGMAELAPESDRDCERIGEARVEGRDAIGFAYVGAAERGESRITLWVDAASGLPLRALIDAPELVYSRVLSRPTKPPQVTLKPTGRRYRETRDFRYGDEASFPTEKRTP